MNLLECFDKNKTDKGSNRHRYDRFYEQEFVRLKNESINILEIGIGYGGSLNALADYFPNAQIYGIDNVCRKWRKKTDRISCFMIDIKKKEKVEQILNDKKFDIIIDDGSHRYDEQLFALKYLIFYLVPKGTYYIEDFYMEDEKAREDPCLVWRNMENRSFYFSQIIHWLKRCKNVQYFDGREGFAPDTFIVKIKGL